MRSATAEPDPSPAAFSRRVERANPQATRAASVDTLMLNVGLRCNLACAHCHQSSSPSRSERMPRDTMLAALELAAHLRPQLIDITGGEPSLWEHLPELVERATSGGHIIRVRTNLVALTDPPRTGLPAFFAEHGVQLLASLPGVTPDEVADQRGDSFDDAVASLRTLAQVGYGTLSRLRLDIAYNPPLGELPRSEVELTARTREALEALGVRFDSLHVIANVPAGRYANRLRDAGEYDAVLAGLADAFNPDVLGELSCRRSIEVAWDGSFSDCDFNLGAGLCVIDGPPTLDDALALAKAGGDIAALLGNRLIAFAPHCFACTAGAGSG